MNTAIQPIKTPELALAQPLSMGNTKRSRNLLRMVAHEPIEFESVDGKAVKILILPVSPIDQTSPHIQALAGINVLMLNEEFKQKLE